MSAKEYAPDQATVDLRKIVNQLLVSFGDEPGQLLSSGAVPVLSTGTDSRQLDTYSLSNGTELAHAMDSSYELFRDANIRQSPADMMNISGVELTRFVKEQELPAEFSQAPLRDQYTIAFATKLVQCVMRSYEADVVLTMLGAGLIPRLEERKDFQAMTFGHANHTKTQEELTTPWERYMRLKRSIVPTHLLLPGGINYAGFVTKQILQTVGFKGGNCDALVRKVSIAQMFVMPFGVDEITVYDISKDKFVTIRRGDISRTVAADLTTYQAELAAAPGKRKRDPVSHVTDFYRRNTALTHPLIPVPATATVPVPPAPPTQPKLIIIQPNVEFLMSSGILFQGGLLTAGFVQSGMNPSIYSTERGTAMRIEANGKTFVADPRGVLTMENIGFEKYLAGGGIQLANNMDAVFAEGRTGNDLLVIPVPQTYQEEDFIELTIGGRDPIRHYQGLQIDTANQVITKARGYLRDGASVPGARAVMDGFKRHFDPVNYNDLLRLV